MDDSLYLIHPSRFKHTALNSNLSSFLFLIFSLHIIFKAISHLSSQLNKPPQMILYQVIKRTRNQLQISYQTLII
jgi:hypothetical protein